MTKLIPYICGAGAIIGGVFAAQMFMLAAADPSCDAYRMPNGKYEGIRYLDHPAHSRGRTTIGHVFATCEEAKASYR